MEAAHYGPATSQSPPTDRYRPIRANYIIIYPAATPRPVSEKESQIVARLYLEGLDTLAEDTRGARADQLQTAVMQV